MSIYGHCTLAPDNRQDNIGGLASHTGKGGKFFKFNPADNLSENPKMNFVAEGYESVADGDWFVVKPVAE